MKDALPAELDFIHGRSLHHPKLVTALEQTMEALLLPNVAVVMVTGSAGVGKSHLRQEVISHAAARFAPIPDPRYLPAVGLEVQVFSDSKSHWTAFYADLQKALAHPNPSMKADKARENIVASVKLRRTRVLLVDEAHHLLFGRDVAKRARAQSEVIKSLTQQIDATVVLLGTYDVIPLMATSGQMARRIRVVHFERYREGSPEDRDTFRALLGFLDRQCEPWLEASLEAQADYLHAGTVGLIGHLHNWLENALAFARRSGGERITRAALEATRSSELNLRTLRLEAEEGERQLRGFGLE